MDSYLEGGVQQVNFIACDQFDVFEAHVLDDLDHIGEWFEESIGSDFQSDALSVINHASSFLTVLKAIRGQVAGGNVLIRDLRNVTEGLASQVSTLSTDLGSLGAACNTAGLSSECGFLSSTHYTVAFNFSEIPDIDFNNHIDLSDIEQQIDTASDIFRDVAGFIDSEAAEYGLKETAESELFDAHSSLEYDYLNPFNESIEILTSDGGKIDVARDKVHEVLKYLDKYRPLDSVGVLLVCLFFLMVTLFAVGVFCGAFGYSRTAKPHGRSSVSNCGGRFIIAGMVVAFVASPVLLVAASATLGLGTGLQKLCRDVQPPDYAVIREVVDDPSVWGGLTLLGRVSLEETYSAVNISIYSSLRGCADNEPIWKALDGDRLYSYYEFDESLNCSSLGVGTDDFQPFDDFNSGDIFPDLSDIEDSFTTIHFREFEKVINETQILSFDLDGLKMNLTTLISITPANSSAHNLAVKVRDDLANIETVVHTLQRLQMNAEGNITQLQHEIEQSEHELVAFSDELNSFLAELPNIVNSTTHDYINHLCGFVEDYINYANDTIRNEVGRCSIFPMAYGALYSTVCDSAVDGVNGYWLGVGWSMLFTLVGVALGVVVSDHYRRAGTVVVRCNDTTSVSNSDTSSLNDDEDEDVSLIQMRPKGKSYPASDWAQPEEQQPLQTTQMDMEW
jgi:prominin 1